MDGLRGGVVAVLEADSDLASILGRGPYDSLPLGRREGQRLFEQHANSGPEAGNSDIGVLMVWCTDVHDIGGDDVHKLVMVGEARRLVPRGRLGERGWVATAHRHKLGVGDRLNRFRNERSRRRRNRPALP